MAGMKRLRSKGGAIERKAGQYRKAAKGITKTSPYGDLLAASSKGKSRFKKAPKR